MSIEANVTTLLIKDCKVVDKARPDDKVVLSTDIKATCYLTFGGNIQNIYTLVLTTISNHKHQNQRMRGREYG